MRRLYEQLRHSLLAASVGHRLPVLVLTDMFTPRGEEVELDKAVSRGAVPVETPPHGSGTPPGPRGVLHRFKEVVDAAWEDVVLDRDQDGTECSSGSSASSGAGQCDE